MREVADWKLRGQRLNRAKKKKKKKKKKEALVNTLADLMSLPGFRADLRGPRTRGSTTERALDALDPTTPVVEFRPTVGNVPVARYFYFDAQALGGSLGAAPLGTLSPDLLPLLRVRHVDKHGPEFYLDRTADAADLPPAPEGVAILGPIDQAGTLGWWTWYVAAGPESRVMGAMTAQGKATDHPVASLAVKLHNG